MENVADFVELLFFDTFAHDNTEEINLDLVQFPKPVYVTEVRIIPLGARVQADFPGGVRLGATNPSQFKIEFFVNDLGKPGASTFESVGGFEYNQNGCINLECARDDTIRKIPTDGLVLRGWYTTITLAVYGTLTKNITEQIIQPVVNPPVVPSQSNLVEPQQILPIETEWPNENLPIPIEYDQATQPYPQTYTQPDPYQPEYQEYYNDPPKDPRNYHVENTEWNKVCPRPNEGERERDRGRDLFEKTGNHERDHRNEPDKRDRDREKAYPSGQIRERDRQPRDYRGSPRDNDHDRGTDRERTRDRSYKHEEPCRRSYGRSSEDKERDERKRPRTPPMMSPKRPKTPHEITETSQENVREQNSEDFYDKKTFKNATEEKEQIAVPVEEPSKIDIEEFEPILSDEDILDDNEQFQDLGDDFTEIGDNDDLIKLYVPGSVDLSSYVPTEHFKVSTESLEITENLKITIGICDDYFKSSITKFVAEDFNKLNTEIKEEFIHLCEKLISIIGSSEKFILITELHKQILEVNSCKWSATDIEISDQIKYVFETTVDWLKIALSYELANTQDQPIYKIRHIKCGLRIAQYCFESEIFVNFLLKNDFNIYNVLLGLYNQEFLAPSIKLMILKALDTSLIHKCSIENFLEIQNDHSGKQNGYEKEEFKSNYKKLLDELRHNCSVRLKFSLCSIIKKFIYMKVSKI
ncbi:hypothetical protein HHI36_019205 [Cryptolaemus montrouzieri]|uniref:Virilizer N-terminal domain-containing protein n=1 Tax=Cryptolaemus montrouzieri TaxID=559131 RepID=A0ABD2P2F4_9CUCU